jgi:hypothetical protein
MAFSSGRSMGNFAKVLQRVFEKNFTKSLNEFFKAVFKVFFSEGGCA